jgi:uncharacterized membrane protein
MSKTTSISAFLVAIAICAIAAVFVSREYRQAKLQAEIIEQANNLIGNWEKSFEQKQPEFETKATVADLSDAEKNALWWRIFKLGETELGPSKVNPEMLQGLADEMGVAPITLFQFFRDNQNAVWRSLYKPESDRKSG